MSTDGEACDVLIVGAGPVGLLLGSMLAARGVDVRLAEKRRSATLHSRAIGVHPPGLSCLHEVGLSKALIDAGVKVKRGRAMLHGESLGVIDFRALTGPFDFVLSVPQPVTERLLEERLAQLAPHALVRDAEACGFTQDSDGVVVTLRTSTGPRTLRARFVVGCDGRRSGVRKALGTSYRGRAYREHFVMADLEDETAFGDEAVVFIGRSGLVESFPLPDGKRRWVANIGEQPCALSLPELLELLRARTGVALSPGALGELSSFYAERFCARRFARGRMVLAGDAAHVVSPIGGQGMNLGFLDARALADTLTACLANEAKRRKLLSAYSRKRRSACARAGRRAELYMSLGFSAPLLLRALSLKALTSTRVAARAARLFTMQGLEA